MGLWVGGFSVSTCRGARWGDPRCFRACVGHACARDGQNGSVLSTTNPIPCSHGDRLASQVLLRMPPKKDDKKAGAKKAASSGGGKAKKKKWSKGKVKEKLANAVLFDKTTYERMLNDTPKQKLITPSIISEKLKVNGSLARKAVKELVSKGLIKPLLTHHSQAIYTRQTKE